MLDFNIAEWKTDKIFMVQYYCTLREINSYPIFSSNENPEFSWICILTI